MIDSVYRKDENCYPQVFLEECKNDVKEKRCLTILLMILIEINISSDDSDRENSDYSDEENSN